VGEGWHCRLSLPSRYWPGWVAVRRDARRQVCHRPLPYRFGTRAEWHRFSTWGRTIPSRCFLYSGGGVAPLNKEPGRTSGIEKPILGVAPCRLPNRPDGTTTHGNEPIDFAGFGHYNRIMAITEPLPVHEGLAWYSRNWSDIDRLGKLVAATPAKTAGFYASAHGRSELLTREQLRDLHRSDRINAVVVRARGKPVLWYPKGYLLTEDDLRPYETPKTNPKQKASTLPVTADMCGQPRVSDGMPCRQLRANCTIPQHRTFQEMEREQDKLYEEVNIDDW